MRYHRVRNKKSSEDYEYKKRRSNAVSKKRKKERKSRGGVAERVKQKVTSLEESGTIYFRSPNTLHKPHTHRKKKKAYKGIYVYSSTASFIQRGPTRWEGDTSSPPADQAARCRRPPLRILLTWLCESKLVTAPINANSPGLSPLPENPVPDQLSLPLPPPPPPLRPLELHLPRADAENELSSCTVKRGE